MSHEPKTEWTCDRCGEQVCTLDTQRMPSGWRSVHVRQGAADEEHKELCNDCTVHFLAAWEKVK